MSTLKEYMISPNTRENRKHIHSLVLSSEKYLTEAIRLLQEEKHPIPNRIAWAIDLCDEMRPGYTQPYLSVIIDELEKPHYSGVYRSLMRLLERYDFPEKEHGRLVELSFRMLNDGAIPVAVKCHAMQIIFAHLRYYPELANELKTSIEFQWLTSSAAFKGRGRKVLHKLETYL